MNNNSANKILIDALTSTHPAPGKAYGQAIDQATPEQAEQIKRIAKALKIKIEQPNKSEIILKWLENSLNEQEQAIADIIERIKNDQIKHSSKAKKEKDLNIQTGYKMALEVVKSNIQYYKNKDFKA